MVSDGTLDLQNNWFKPGWRASHGQFRGTIRDDDSSLAGTAPGFRNPDSGDFRLSATSRCIDASVRLHPDVPPEHRVMRQ
jgi:hypothetical protein